MAKWDGNKKVIAAKQSQQLLISGCKLSQITSDQDLNSITYTHHRSQDSVLYKESIDCTSALSFHGHQNYFVSAEK